MRLKARLRFCKIKFKKSFVSHFLISSMDLDVNSLRGLIESTSKTCKTLLSKYRLLREMEKVDSNCHHAAVPNIYSL